MVSLTDSQLSGVAPVLENRVGALANQLSIADLQNAIDPVVSAIFSISMEKIGAYNGTIWLVNGDRTHLVAAYCDRKKELEGKAQPLDEGLISLVIASEQGVCENGVFRNQQHCKRIDEELGIVTCGMIAVPFYLAGQLRGAVSCVVCKASIDDPDPPEFRASHLREVQFLSIALERLIHYRLIQQILGLFE